MKRTLAVVAALALWGAPAGVFADHDPPHDTRPNPNCAWDSKRSTDWSGDGEPDHFVLGVGVNTTFPRQVVNLIEPLTGIDHIPPFFGGNDGPNNVSVVAQGDHRMFGANPSHSPDGEPEQEHGGAVYAHVDFDDIEEGRAPEWRAGFGIYEGSPLVMACASSDPDDEPEWAACLQGQGARSEGDCPGGF